MPRLGDVKCSCGTCKTCKQRAYSALSRSRAAARRPEKPRKLDELDRKAIEVWARHKPAEPEMRWRCPIADFEGWVAEKG